MCIIMCALGNVAPPREHLEQSCRNNPDGFGFAMVTERDGLRQLIVRKSMTSGNLIDEFEDAFTRYGKSVVAWAFHARIATHGKVNEQNCHPFPVGNQAVMFHNGVLPVYQAPTDPRTDSETFASDYLPTLGGVPASWQACDVIGRFAGQSKLVFLEPQAEMPLVIVNEDLGQWNGDIWYSNTSYIPWTYAVSSSSNEKLPVIEVDDDGDFFVTCDVCDQTGPVSDEFCAWCTSCYSCGMFEDTCQCWTPSPGYQRAWEWAD